MPATTRLRADDRRGAGMTTVGARLEPQEAAEAAFRSDHPRYAETAVVDELRVSDFARLDAAGTSTSTTPAAACYAESQLAEHVRAAARATCSATRTRSTPPRRRCTELVERRARRVLDFFRASPDEYVAIFTPNATGALRLVGEAYPFRPGDRFLLTFDNHNSVNGIREFARARGAETTYVPSVAPDLRVDERPVPALPERHRRRSPQPVRLPGAVELLRRPAPAGVDRAGARSTAGTCCSTRPRSCRPTGSTCAAGTPTSSRSRSTRCSATRPASAACSRAATRSRSSSGRGSRGGTIVAAFVQREYYQCGSRRGALRGRHGQLPRPAGDRDRPALPRARRHRHDPRARAGARRLAARRARLAASTATAHRPRRSTGRRAWSRRGATIAFNFLHPDGARRRRALRGPRRAASTTSRSARAASATPARARSPSRSRARRSSAASSARA